MAAKFREITDRAESLIEQGNEAVEAVGIHEDQVNIAINQVHSAENALASAKRTDSNGRPLGNVSHAQAQLKMAQGQLAAAKRALKQAEDRVEEIKNEKRHHVQTITQHNRISKENLEKIEMVKDYAFSTDAAQLARGIVNRINLAEEAKVRLQKSMGIPASADVLVVTEYSNSNPYFGRTRSISNFKKTSHADNGAHGSISSVSNDLSTTGQPNSNTPNGTISDADSIGAPEKTKGARRFKIARATVYTEAAASDIYKLTPQRWLKRKRKDTGIPKSVVCFVADTQVLTSTGVKAICEIKVGDSVISTNPVDGRTDICEVTDTYCSQSDQLLCITIEESEIRTTHNHPFYVNDAGWVEAGRLKPGDKLLTYYGRLVSVSAASTQVLDTVVNVYNFQVADLHSYHVGELLILAHNANCTPRSPRKGVIREVYIPKVYIPDVDKPEDYIVWGTMTYTKMVGNEEVSITYSREGYPDFSGYTHKEYKTPIEIEYTGKRNKDFKLANAEIGLAGKKPPKGYTWHHVEDGKGMLLVRKDVHAIFSHTGGFSINEAKARRE